MHRAPLIVLLASLTFGLGSSMTTSLPSNIPSGPALDNIIVGSFNNFDSDKDGFIEKYEFDTFVIVRDSNNDGCMTLEEYKLFTAGTSDVATKIYHHFDPKNTNCITVDKVASEFAKMDVNVADGKVTLEEFRNYYIHLLQTLYSPAGQTVG